MSQLVTRVKKKMLMKLISCQEELWTLKHFSKLITAEIRKIIKNHMWIEKEGTGMSLLVKIIISFRGVVKAIFHLMYCWLLVLCVVSDFISVELFMWIAKNNNAVKSIFSVIEHTLIVWGNYHLIHFFGKSESISTMLLYDNILKCFCQSIKYISRA